MSKRACLLTYEVIFWVVLAMGLLTNLPIRQVLKHARRLREGEESPARQAPQARQRLGVAPVRDLSRGHTCSGSARYAGVVLHEFRLIGIDGTVLGLRLARQRRRLRRPTAGPPAMGPFPRSRRSAWSSWAPTSRSLSSSTLPERRTGDGRRVAPPSPPRCFYLRHAPSATSGGSGRRPGAGPPH